MISEVFVIELSLQASSLKVSEPQDRSHRQGLNLLPFFVKRSSIQSPVFKTSYQTFKYSSAQAFHSSTDSVSQNLKRRPTRHIKMTTGRY
ncbi:hypothetical protein DFH07DRAFT_1063074 [Mycena maculata]|uniref:Uncharacterized protein n=1 Tax=Mycena maculata TaxID=230809 RepID=A0AAD7IM14_9AGAR|nr:hypothetical protein DFH07DRAFT_1063074 [Mycena maculata]